MIKIELRFTKIHYNIPIFNIEKKIFFYLIFFVLLRLK